MVETLGLKVSFYQPKMDCLICKMFYVALFGNDKAETCSRSTKDKKREKEIMEIQNQNTVNKITC